MSPSIDSMGDNNNPDSDSDDDADSGDCENLITDLASRLRLPSRVVDEVSQFANVSARIINANNII